MNAIVIGSGVSGLSTAIRLQEAGHRVHIVTADLPATTTSSVAAAIWYPYRAYPEDLVLRWSSRTFEVLLDLIEQPQTGVILREGVELWREPTPDPWWRDAVRSFGRVPADQMPPGYRDAYLFSVPVIEMPIYLHYLTHRFTAGGGRIEQRTLRSLDQIEAADILVDCAGLGARDLASDPLLRPIRGQIVRVRNPGLHRFVLDEHHPDGIVYIVPRSTDCILGGTAQEGDWDRTPDPAVTAAIVARCAAIEPRLADAEILEHKVGLRPGRPAIRLEREDRNGAIVIHNYGHGGSGVTVSWGCAEDVVRLIG